MPTFRVHFVNTVSATVKVEADDYNEAIELAYDSPDMPGGITVGAFGVNHDIDDGEWTVNSVSDVDGKTVYRESGN